MKEPSRGSVEEYFARTKPFEKENPDDLAADQTYSSDDDA